MTRSLLSELKRRNVLRAGAFYIAAVRVLAQGIAQLGPAFGMPEWPLVRNRGSHRLSVPDRVRLILRVHAGRTEARERGRAARRLI